MKYIEIGKIAGTFGIKGELKVISDSDFKEERFTKGSTLYLEKGSKMEKVTITSARFHKNFVIITINGLYDINLVLPFVGLKLFVDQDSLKELPEGEFYIHELIGVEVFNTLGERLGVVKDVISYPGSDILEVFNEESKKMLIPFHDAFLEEVQKDKIIIKEIEGMR